MKILNLYAGIGGNRKLWKGHQITAVEIDPKIAEIYKQFFPDDEVIIADAHQYLLDHYQEFDFIWSSPPCPTHSRMRNLKNNCPECEKKYPDMKLYEEIIYLKHFFKGKWVVENVISYYDPLIKPVKSASHYFWSNIKIPELPMEKRNIRKDKQEHYGFDLTNLQMSKRRKMLLLNNCVNPEIALMILNETFK